MRTNEAGIDLIKSFEGIMDGDPQTVNLDPYLDPVNVWTIGWGHVVLDETGRPIRGRENRDWAFRRWPNGISYEQAEALLAEDLWRYEQRVERFVTVPLNPNQFSALVSWDFNTGGIDDSTLTKKLNKGLYWTVPDQMKRWNKGTIQGRKVVLQGLVRRRRAEAALWKDPLTLEQPKFYRSLDKARKEVFDT